MNPLLTAAFLLLMVGYSWTISDQMADQAKMLCKDVDKPFFSVSCNAAGACTAAPQRRESQESVFAIPKPAGVKRVFVIGESAAKLLSTIDKLGEALPGLETINCGMGGYESRRIAGVFKEVLSYEPDLIIILSGNNEGRSYPCGGLTSAIRRRGVRMLERFYAWQYGDRLAPVKASLRIHEMFLATMAKEAGERKVPFILCTLPANLRGIPPQYPLPLEKASFAAGMTSYEKGDMEKAAVWFRKSRERGPHELFSHFYLARTLEAQRRFAEAKTEYLGILDLEERQDRTSPERNKMIRRIAALEGAGLCDLELAFYGIAGNGIPGFEQLTDAVHWWPSYNGLVWNEIAKTARSMGLAWFKGPAPSPPPGLSSFSEDDMRKSFSYALKFIDANSSIRSNPKDFKNGVLSERALAEIDFIEAAHPGLLGRTVLSERAFNGFFMKNFWSAQTADQLERLRPFFIAHLAEAERRRGNAKKALSLLEHATTSQPDKPYYRLIKALSLLGLNRRDEAGKELEALYHAPDMGRKALAVANAYGLSTQGLSAEHPTEEDGPNGGAPPRDWKDAAAVLAALSLVVIFAFGVLREALPSRTIVFRWLSDWKRSRFRQG